MNGNIPEYVKEPLVQCGRKLSLNFTDKDDKENAKFNDSRFVDILRNYPLLYNKSLGSFGDPDYTQWMWGEIANEMNEPHRKTTLNLPFNWTDCRDQWEVVKKALRYLSNPAAKSFRYPKHFRECLQFFQNYVKDRREPIHTDRSQDLFLQHVHLLEHLPFEKQLTLEKEVLNVILSSELEFCAPIVDPQAIEAQASEEFGRVIGLLMPEVELQIVKNEMATEPERFIMDDFIHKTENTDVIISEPITDVAQLLDLYSQSGISLNHTGSHFDLDNLLQIPSKRVEIVPQMEEGLIECDLQDVIEEDVIEEDVIQHEAMQEDGANEIVCVFQEDTMQEVLIEEVVPQGTAKELPSLGIDGNFQVPVNSLDFDCVLNEMLE